MRQFYLSSGNDKLLLKEVVCGNENYGIRYIERAKLIKVRDMNGSFLR